LEFAAREIEQYFLAVDLVQGQSTKLRQLADLGLCLLA
jgi:hypothetical protein